MIKREDLGCVFHTWIRKYMDSKASVIMYNLIWKMEIGWSYFLDEFYDVLKKHENNDSDNKFNDIKFDLEEMSKGMWFAADMRGKISDKLIDEEAPIFYAFKAGFDLMSDEELECFLEKAVYYKEES